MCHPCFSLCYIWVSDPYSMACTVACILSTAESTECIHSTVQSWNVYIPQFVHWMYTFHGFSHWMYTFHSYLHSMQHIYPNQSHDLDPAVLLSWLALTIELTMKWRPVFQISALKPSTTRVYIFCNNYLSLSKITAKILTVECNVWV